MKYFKKIIFCFVFMLPQVIYALESDETLEYIEKNKKQAIEVFNYKAKVEKERIKEKERAQKIKEIEAAEAAQMAKLSLEEQIKFQEVKKAEQKRNAHLEFLRQEQIKKKQLLEARLNRTNTIKIVRLVDRNKSYRSKEEYIKTNKSADFSNQKIKSKRLSDLDKVELNLNKNKTSLLKYADVGHEELYSTPAIDRTNILSNDIYVSLLTQSSISSRKMGSFLGLVENNIYSPDSSDILLPKGSKFECHFETLNIGDTSINASCNEIILPNGKKIKTANMPVYDQMGRIGIVGVLDNRLWEKYGQAIITSTLGAFANLLASKTPTTNDTKNFFNYTALNGIDLSNNILKNTINLAPIVTVSSGTRVLVKLTKVINFIQEELNDYEEDNK